MPCCRIALMREVLGERHHGKVPSADRQWRDLLCRSRSSTSAEGKGSCEPLQVQSFSGRGPVGGFSSSNPASMIAISSSTV